MNIRIESSSLANKNISGVGNYTRLLAEALDDNPDMNLRASYFNFLNRQPKPNLNIKLPLESMPLIPLRIYAKLQSFGIAPPFDIMLPRVDLTIFPNFATWPTAKSNLRATVVHDLTYIHFPDLVESANLSHLRRVVPRSIKKADFIITVSEAVKSELIKMFSLPPEKCVVTTIPPDNSFYKINKNEIHKKYKIPTRKYIYFIGNLEPRKNLPVLIDAYVKLPVKLKNEYSLILAGGKGWKTEKTVQAIKDAKWAKEKVVHIGFVDKDDAPAMYQNASLFVMPSIYEGFGMPILESMASGCPVLASDIPVLHEVAGEAALFAKTHDSTNFSNKIEKILSDTSLQKDLVKKGKLQLKKFSWQKNTEIILEKIKKTSRH